MIPYEQLAAALERPNAQPAAAVAVTHAEPPPLEDPTINADHSGELEIGEVLSDDQDFT